MKKFLSVIVSGFFIVPSTAFALPGVGPRVTIEGEIQQITITEEQLFDDEGGEFTMLAKNGQTVSVVIHDGTNIVTEGRVSTKKMRPRDLRTGMYVRVTGLRIGTDGITASLLIITNVETNPGLSSNGVITSYENNVITMLTANGTSVSYTVDDDTEVVISYTMKGPTGLSVIGKQALFSVSPTDTTRLKVIRITGKPEVKAARPAVRELRTIRYRRGRGGSN